MENNNINNFNPIHDDNCEEYVLGTLISNKKAIDESREILDENCFYNTKYKYIFKVIKELDSKGEDISIISILPELQKVGILISPSELMEIASKSFIYDYYQYVLRLHELSGKRKIFEMGYYLMQVGSNEVDDVNDILNETRKKIDNFTDLKSDQYIKLDVSLRRVSEIVNRNLSNENEIIGTPTGFTKIDEKGGLQKGDLIIIAGETSQGKTAMALSITKNAIENEKKVAYYSMEMESEKLTSRLISMKSEISSSEILYGKLQGNDLALFDKAIGALENKYLYYDDRSSSNIDVILSSIRNMKMKYDIDGAVVDYLQILNVNRNNRNSSDEQLMGDVARRLKNIAKDLGIWIIALSQLNRNQDNPIPTLSRLRSSGQIAEAADTVMLIYRPEYYGKKFPEPFENKDTHGTALIDIAKGRNIGTTKFICRFNSKCTYFYEDESIGNYCIRNTDNSPF